MGKESCIAPSMASSVTVDMRHIDSAVHGVLASAPAIERVHLAFDSVERRSQRYFE